MDTLWIIALKTVYYNAIYYEFSTNLVFFLGILFFYIMYLIWICHIAMKAQKCQHLIASFCVFYEYFIDDVIWLAKHNIYCTICVNTRWCNIIQSASIHRLALWFVFVWLFIFQKCNFIGFRRNILNISLDSLIKYTMNFKKSAWDIWHNFFW